jgi:CheY-like chemotaxis protein
LIDEFFKNTNVRIFQAENAIDGIEIAKKQNPDLIFMDLKMPVLDGFEATKRIKSDDKIKNIPVVALSASVMEGDLTKIKKIGFDGFVMKPAQMNDILEEASKFIKFTKKKAEETTAREVQESRSSGGVSQEIISQLENEILEEWEEIKKDHFIHEILDFAKKIQDMGTINSINLLEEYGASLALFAESFDIENMDITLNSFPEFIEDIKKL